MLSCHGAIGFLLTFKPAKSFRPSESQITKVSPEISEVYSLDKKFGGVYDFRLGDLTNLMGWGECDKTQNLNFSPVSWTGTTVDLMFLVEETGKYFSHFNQGIGIFFFAVRIVGMRVLHIQWTEKDLIYGRWLPYLNTFSTAVILTEV